MDSHFYLFKMIEITLSLFSTYCFASLLFPASCFKLEPF
jgi:hypothetical protein